MNIEKPQNDLRGNYWSIMQTVKFQENYAKEYNSLIGTIERVTLTMLSITTAASVASWSIWQNYRGWWLILVAASELLQLIWQHLPFSKQISALKYVIPEIKQLTLDMENYWFESEHRENPDYIEAIKRFRQRWQDIQSKYFDSDSLPDIKWIREKADKITANHMDLFFDDSSDQEGGGSNDTKEAHSADGAHGESSEDSP